MPERDLNDLPDGSSIFVDTNIFHYHFEGKSLDCTNFISRIQNREIDAYVNLQTMTDLLHRLMMAEALVKGYCRDLKGNNQGVRGLKFYLKGCRDRQQAFPLSAYQAQFEFIASIGLHVLPMTERLLVETKAERERYYLMVGDSLHVGTMSRRTIKRRKAPLQDIATNDGDFADIPGVTIWRPMDAPHSARQGATHVP